jgi:hypothetical protein
MAYINQNRFKKTYGYKRAIPVYATVTIDDAGTTIEINRNQIKVDRQFYLLPEAIDAAFTGFQTGEYEEDDFVVTASVDSVTITFATPFTSTPIVVASPNTSSNNLHNINLFVDSVSTTQAILKFSANFSGSLRYRAIYASSYPARVQRTPLFPGSYYDAAAGTILTSNESSTTVTYPNIGGSPTDAFLTAQDYNNNETAQVNVELASSLGLTSTTVSISSPLSNQINFIVVKS